MGDERTALLTGAATGLTEAAGTGGTAVTSGTTGATEVLGDPEAVRRAADALAEGCAVVHGFANFYALTARADRETVTRVNRLKGRPDGWTGSVVTVPSGLSALFDWTRLPAELPRRQIWSLMAELYELGPFGFRGPAAPAVPEHLTAPGAGQGTPAGSPSGSGGRSVQVVAPGRHCPSNAFLAAALDRTGAAYLFVTSANRPGELPHWRGGAALRDFHAEPGVRVLAHPDDEAARRRHPHHAPVSVSILSFDRAAGRGRSGLPALTLERQGSLSAAYVRSVAANHGFAVTLAPAADGTPPPAPRVYLPPVRR
ncbi:L-threonylcarbamoyladenylate synthase [Streptomyces sp. NPDC090025]|uniref:L-threonylcarbamoyladenylate synthase n=1 Tax=Streptomyces sp. NPDC090025 TaxID=3365922 RepID=UPI003837E7BC